MNKSRAFAAFAAIGLLTAGSSVLAVPVGTAFTYQGLLENASGRVTDTCEFEFSLWNDAVLTDPVNQVGSTITLDGTGGNPSPIDVDDGLFTATLDFGSGAFDGNARWLAMGVKCTGDVDFTALEQRQELTPAPHAMRAIEGVGPANAINVDTATGKVGIGTTSPGSPLSVAGEIESTSGGFKFPDGSVQTSSATAYPWSVSGNDIFYTAGSVGIGTTGPFLPIGDTLVTKSAMLPSPRNVLACASSGVTGKIYCFGGEDDAGNLFDQIVEYNPGTDTLIPQSATLPSPTLALACAAAPGTGMIYCFGGNNRTADLNEIVEYDPDTDTRTTMTAVLPSGRAHLACVAGSATGRIYCFGGSEGTILLDQIVEYDPANPDQDAVTMTAVLPSGRYGLACAADPATGKIYCFGGYDGTGPLDEIVEYDPGIPDVPGPIPIMDAVLPSERYVLACATDPATGKIYCFGGWDGLTLNEIVEYDPDIPDVPGPIPIMDAVLPLERGEFACSTDAAMGKIYCFGGRNTSGRLNEIVEYTPSAGPALLQVGEPGGGAGAIANAWNVFSSLELKRDIAPLKRGDYQDILTELNATDAVHFRYAYDPRRTLHLGVIAENSPAEILSPDGKAVSLADYTTFLMAAIKAQQALIEERDCQVSEVQEQLLQTNSRMAELEERVDKLGHAKKGGSR